MSIAAATTATIWLCQCHYHYLLLLAILYVYFYVSKIQLHLRVRVNPPSCLAFMMQQQSDAPSSHVSMSMCFSLVRATPGRGVNLPTYFYTLAPSFMDKGRFTLQQTPSCEML